MSYRIESLSVRNFKCFDNSKFYTFNFAHDANTTILSGPNGFGKTTFFDAIELIFTKRITRLNSDIEDGRTNLGKNILLNTSNDCGYLVLTLIDHYHSAITIIAKIDNSLTRLAVESAIKFTFIDGKIDINGFDEMLSGRIDWKEEISDFRSLNYIKEHFNIYYYTSQAESVHFLKNSISSRKDSMTKLLQTETIQKKIDKIEKSLIGANKAKSGVLINDAIKNLKAQLEKLVYNYNSKFVNIGGQYTETVFSPLLSYPQYCEAKKWDLENLVSNDISERQLVEYINEINGIYNLYHDLSDYRKYLKNNEVNKFLNNNDAIASYAKYRKFLNGGKFDRKQVEGELEILNRTLEAFKYSSFFRNEMDISKYKKEDMIFLHEIGLFSDTVSIDELDNLISEAKSLSSQLGDSQKRTNDLIQARDKLHSVKKNNTSPNQCPYCNSLYDNPELLEEAYASLSMQLISFQNSISQELQGKKTELSIYTLSIVDTLEKLFKRENYSGIEQIQTTASEYSTLLKSEKRIESISMLHDLVGEEFDSWNELDGKSQIIELKKIIESKISSYDNRDFDDNLLLYDYDRLFKENLDILSIEQSNLKNRVATDNKIMFLKFQNSLSINSELVRIKDEIRMLVIELKKLDKIRNCLEELKNLYNSKIDEYKNLVLKKLRVPLLIYTGKILQDYQNGLGVFVNKDEMRFVSNGDAKHDILNTFSSGQLSGFVLSFLFAMNKRYISEYTDDIGFILIDDPVQTMDDINIASFIEVLRNDFPNKQIILSTHETDKENYILYKFLKYNLIGQSLNVKDEMY